MWKLVLLSLFPITLLADLAVSEIASGTYRATKTSVYKKRDGTSVEVVDPNKTRVFRKSELEEEKAYLQDRIDKINLILTEIGRL
jgi:hypothetical protein